MSSSIRSIHQQPIVDSHVGLTTEYTIVLDDGRSGTGSSSRGETISIYEDRATGIDPRRVIDAISDDGLIGTPIDQGAFDAYLAGKWGDFGRNTCFALSLALYNAAEEQGKRRSEGRLPRLCLNVLNGGFHAYTNPVLSDFSEFMLVPRNDDLLTTLKDHGLIQEAVKTRLLVCDETVVSGNRVHALEEKDNAAPLRLLIDVLKELGLKDSYDLMIDASATDLRTPEGYRLSITEDRERTPRELLSYWLELIETYSIGFLEDPFHEEDLDSWAALTRQCGERCTVIGDNLYTSEAARIEQGARSGCSTAALIKPNQAGTVTATVAAISTAVAGGLTPITSHRSISTESTFVCDMTWEHRVPYMKIGPLLTDYSSVIRLNRLLRLAGLGYE